jgi:uncharacterized membrane protein YidH (DUF202 family)
VSEEHVMGPSMCLPCYQTTVSLEVIVLFNIVILIVIVNPVVTLNGYFHFSYTYYSCRRRHSSPPPHVIHIVIAIAIL